MKLIRYVVVLIAVLGIAIGHPQTAAKPAADSKMASSAKKPGLIDINSASADELQTLPGIGPALSKKIVDGRPYSRKDELVSKKVIPAATYSKIKAQIVARQKK